MQSKKSDLTALVGKRIARADSSLKNFSVALDDGSGLQIDAIDDEGDARLAVTLPAAEALPNAKEAVCAVDWSWIYNSTIKNASADSSRIRLQLDPAGPLIVSVSVWQGSSFLAFQPFKPPAK